MRKIVRHKEKFNFLVFGICYIICIKLMDMSQGKMSQGKIMF